MRSNRADLFFAALLRGQAAVAHAFAVLERAVPVPGLLLRPRSPFMPKEAADHAGCKPSHGCPLTRIGAGRSSVLPAGPP